MRRDEGLPLPAGLILSTPELDLTESGDSFQTNLGLDTALRSLMTVNRYEAQAQLLHALNTSPVVLDRYWLSSLVYGEAEGLDTEWIVEISSTLLKPDLTIVLDIPVCAVGQRRPQARDKNETDLDKLQRVRDLYRASNGYTHQNHTVILDADRPLDVVKNAVYNLINCNFSVTSGHQPSSAVTTI